MSWGRVGHVRGGVGHGVRVGHGRGGVGHVGVG